MPTPAVAGTAVIVAAFTGPAFTGPAFTGMAFTDPATGFTAVGIRCGGSVLTGVGAGIGAAGGAAVVDAGVAGTCLYGGGRGGQTDPGARVCIAHRSSSLT